MGIKTIIIGVVALAVVGSGVFVVVNSKNKNEVPAAQSSNLDTKNLTSINGLLAQNKNLRCTYSHTDENGNKSSGTAYIAGNRMSGNFKYQVAGTAEQNSNVLRDSEYQYVWADGSNTGFKTKISELTADTQDSSTSEQQGVDQDADYDFDCSDWSVDESLFSQPAGVEFTDYSAQLQQSQELQQNISEACAQIADPAARTACENAL